MDTGITLKSIFADNRENLSNKLQGLSLPKDSQHAQKIVSDFLSDMFENEGAFRQNLTESEDFILQAVLRLLQAQQNIAVEFTKASTNSQPDLNLAEETSVTSNNAYTSYLSVAGAGVGAFAGSFITTWATIAGAIAGTALVIYCSTRLLSKPSVQTDVKAIPAPSLLNPSAFCSIIENVCECIDGVIDTYRIQIRRIANSYEQREQPTLQNTYSTLLEQIANVIQTSKNCGDDVPLRLKNAICIMEESLENYNLRFNNGKIESIG